MVANGAWDELARWRKSIYTTHSFDTGSLNTARSAERRPKINDA